MARTIILKEYDYLQMKDSSQINYLDEKAFLSLESFILQNEHTQYLKVTTKKGYGKIIKAQNYCGVIQIKDGTIIEIVPKISEDTNSDKSKEILLKMLKTLKKSPFKNINKANLKSSKLPLLELFISMFLDEVSKLIRKGIKSDYIQKEENLKYLKGKLQINEQIKQNYIHKERFYIQFDEFLNNRVENKLIKTTLEFLYKKSKSNRNQQLIREFLFVFDDIEISHSIKEDFTKVKLNRQMKEYEQVLIWCRTFLLENSFSPYSGKDIAFALLFDMNMLFESYVGHYLKKKGFEVNLQDRGKYLVDSHNKFALRPDIKIKTKDKIIIADTKWKKIENEKDISQADMYQLFAYGKKYDEVKKLYIIYPKFMKTQPKLSYKYEDRLPLEIIYFDITKR